MPEINLLPNEFRRQESKQLASAKKAAGGLDMKFHEPEKEKAVKSEKPGLFSRFFSGRSKKAPIKPAAKNGNGKLVPEKKESIKPVLINAEKKPERRDELKFDFKNDPSLIFSHEADRRSAKPAAPKELPKTVPVASSPAVQRRLKKPSFFSRLFKARTPKPVRSPLPINPAPKPQPIKPLPPVMALPAPVKKPELARPEKPANGQKPFVPPQKPMPVIVQKPVAPKKPAGTEKLNTQPLKQEKSKYLDINLMPADLAKIPERQFGAKALITGVLVAVFGLLIVFGYLGLTWYQIIMTRQIQDVKDQIFVLDEQIKNFKDDESRATKLQARLKLIEELLSGHIYWTKFFSLLEKHTINEVYYTNFSMSGRDRLVIAAIGKDYSSVSSQLLAFQEAKDFVKSVRIDSASAIIDKAGSYSGVSFNVSLEFQPDVFFKPIQ